MHLFILRVEWRILYVIFINKRVKYEEITKNFDINEIPLLTMFLNNLISSNVATFDGEYYSLNNSDNHPFLKILNYFYTMKIPETRTDIRNKVKHKILQEALDELTKSGILFEYRMEINRKVYIMDAERKDEFIKIINDTQHDTLDNGESVNDKAHLIMIDNNIPIISTNTDVDCVKIENKMERKVVKFMLNDIRNKRKLGNTFEEILIVFNNNKKNAEKTILNLIEKGIIKCSRRNIFYINNAIIQLLRGLLL